MYRMNDKPDMSKCGKICELCVTKKFITISSCSLCNELHDLL